MKSPLATVKEKFGDKAKLIAAVEKFNTNELWVSRTNKDKGLAHVSNAKLLRLHELFATVKEKFGTRAKLVDAILDLEKRTKDEGYKTRLLAFPIPRLWDMYRSTSRRAAVSPAAEKTAVTSKSAEKKPLEKKAPEKKTVAKRTLPKKSLETK